MSIKEIFFQHPKIVGIEAIEQTDRSIKGKYFKMRYLSDELQIVGFAALPENFDLKHQYPIIIYNHGGSFEFGKVESEDFGFLATPYLEHGYTVFASQYRGIDGSEGKEQYGGEDVHDVLNLLELVKSFEFIDRKNSFMIGLSRGAMMTYLAIKQGAQINAAVVIGGPSDLERIHKARPNLFRIHKKAIPSLVENYDEACRERSALYWPEELNTPLLILHGDADDSVHVSHSINLAEKLSQLSKPFRLKILSGGNHSLKSHRLERRALTLEWFQQHALLSSENTSTPQPLKTNLPEETHETISVPMERTIAEK